MSLLLSFSLFLLASRTDISFDLHITLQWILELIIGIFLYFASLFVYEGAIGSLME